MPHDLLALTITAATIAFFHTLLGPDHYLPFIAMGRAGSWSGSKTLCIAALCGIGHILGSVVLGAVVIGAGVLVSNLEIVESARGSLAAWALLSFGIVYTAWGLRRGLRDRPHAHSHVHADGTLHDHEHAHHREHAHPHGASDGAKLAPWVLFTIFVLGPCEPLIPVLLVPAFQHSFAGVIWVTIVFAVVTLVTVLGLVFAGLAGLGALPQLRIQKFSHAFAGVTLCLCGLFMIAGF